MDPADLTESTIRMAVAAVLGGMIGFEREMHSQAAGLRTHMVVAVGAALIMILSVKVAGPAGDPGRIAAQVVSGIGFLGAGAILRFGMSIKGLTTAACLWTAAGIGLAAGAGFWREAGVATIIVVLAVFVFDFVEKTMIIGRRYSRFVVTAKDQPQLVDHAEAKLGELGVVIKHLGISRDKTAGRVELTITGTLPESTDVETTVRRLSDLDGVEKVDVD